MLNGYCFSTGTFSLGDYCEPEIGSSYTELYNWHAGPCRIARVQSESTYKMTLQCDVCGPSFISFSPRQD